MSRKLCFVVIVVTLAVSFVSAVSAATWNVSDITGLRTAVAAAAPGDVILMADGTYSFSDAIGCLIQDKNNLTIRSASGNRAAVIMTGLGQDSRKTQFGFKIFRSPHITIQDITIKNIYWHCIQVNEGSSYAVLRNLYMWDAGEGPLKVTSLGPAGPYCDYGLLENSTLGYTTKGTRGNVEGVDIVGNVGWTIRNTDFYNVTKLQHNDAACACFAKGNSQDTIVEGCYFQGCDIAISFGDGGTGSQYFRDGDTTYEHRRGIIRNNIVHNTKDVAIYLRQSIDFKVYNNTLWSTFSAADSSIDTNIPPCDGLIVDNICSQNYRLRNGATATLTNNIFHASPSLFVNQAAADYHLLSTATSAINMGINSATDVPTDWDWQTRPYGSALDIGADEYYP